MEEKPNLILGLLTSVVMYTAWGFGAALLVTFIASNIGLTVPPLVTLLAIWWLWFFMFFPPVLLLSNLIKTPTDLKIVVKEEVNKEETKNT